MNVTFKTIRRAGDKLYVLSEISGYDECLPVVLSASTGAGARIPSDTYPYCDVDDSLALQQVLCDGALACHEPALALPHAKNSAGVRFFVIVLPWLEIARWSLDFNAIDSSGEVVQSCHKVLDILSSSLKSLASQRSHASAVSVMEDLDGRFIHDRIRVRFLRAVERGERVLVSALVEMPFHEESAIEFDFLDKRGMPISPQMHIVEDSLSQPSGFGALRRRSLVVSFEVDRDDPQLCLCATDTQGTIAPGFAMLGERTFNALIDEFCRLSTSAHDDPAYHEWFCREHRADIPALLEQVATRFDYAPLLSVVCVLADTPPHHVHDLFNSIAQQSYERWELILVDATDDHCASSAIKDGLGDERVFVIEADAARGYDECFESGLAAAEGDFVLLMRAHDVLAPDALFECVRMMNEHPDCDLLYTDVDTVDAEGIHSSPAFRPAFSPELLRSYNYMRDFLVVRATLLADAMPPNYAPLDASTYDLVLRLSERAARVCHVPRVLCHRRFASVEENVRLSRFEQEAGRKALVEHCRRQGIDAEVLSTDVAGRYRVRHVLADKPRVSVVVLSGGNAPLLQACIRSLYERIRYADFEVVALDPHGLVQREPALIADLQAKHPTFSLLPWEGPVNRGAMANFAAERTQGAYLLYISDDARILTEDALEVLLGYFQREDVGVVGPKQLFVDGTIEHAGIVVGGSRGVTPLFRHMPAEWRGYLDRAVVAQNVSAVTGDCMMVRRSVLERVGGFSEEFSMFYADVDFCLKAREAGFYTVFTPYVELGRSRSVSRIRTRSKRLRIENAREAAKLKAAWPRCFVEGDAFSNPNLDPDSSYFALRRSKG